MVKGKAKGIDKRLICPSRKNLKRKKVKKKRRRENYLKKIATIVCLPGLAQSQNPNLILQQ